MPAGVALLVPVPAEQKLSSPAVNKLLPAATAPEHMLLMDFLWGKGLSVDSGQLLPDKTTCLAWYPNGQNLSMASCHKSNFNWSVCDDLKWVCRAVFEEGWI